MEVEDSGCGIDEKNRDLIFKAFKQQSTTTSRFYGGTGLGLSIVQMLTHKMGGRVHVGGNPDGAPGSRFRLVLPIWPEGAGQQEEDELEELQVEEKGEEEKEQERKEGEEGNDGETGGGRKEPEAVPDGLRWPPTRTMRALALAPVPPARAPQSPHEPIPASLVRCVLYVSNRPLTISCLRRVLDYQFEVPCAVVPTLDEIVTGGRGGRLIRDALVEGMSGGGGDDKKGYDGNIGCGGHVLICVDYSAFVMDMYPRLGKWLEDFKTHIRGWMGGRPLSPQQRVVMYVQGYPAHCLPESWQGLANVTDVPSVHAMGSMGFVYPSRFMLHVRGNLGVVCGCINCCEIEIQPASEDGRDGGVKITIGRNRNSSRSSRSSSSGGGDHVGPGGGMEGGGMDQANDSTTADDLQGSSSPLIVADGGVLLDSPTVSRGSDGDEYGDGDGDGDRDTDTDRNVSGDGGDGDGDDGGDCGNKVLKRRGGDGSGNYGMVMGGEGESGDGGGGKSLPSPSAPRRLRILVVDDVATNRNVMLRMVQRVRAEVEKLREVQVEVSEVENGYQAVDACKNWIGGDVSFDDGDGGGGDIGDEQGDSDETQKRIKVPRNKVKGLILMDCNMPGCDGFEATRKIRAIEATTAAATGDNTSRVTIIALTASSGKATRSNCFAAGMDDVLTKPVKIKDVKTILMNSWKK